MKKAIKKIVALGMGATMLGATALTAAAADLRDYPSMFKSADGKSFNALLVVGKSAAGEDVIGATMIAMNLQYGMSETKVVPGSTATTTVEGGRAIETSGQKLYYGDYFDTNIMTSMTETELPALLAKGNVVDNDGTSYEVKQSIKMPNARVQFGKTIPNLQEPALYIDWQTGIPNYTLEVNFPTVLKLGDNITDEPITLFGREYTFSGTPSDITTAAITLYGGGVDQTFAAGDSATVNVGGTQVDVEVLGVNTQTLTAQATVVVNGESKQVTAGRTYTVGGIRIYVKDIFAYTVPAASGAVRLFIGTDKLVLTNESSVKMGSGSTTIDGTTVTLSTSSGKLSTLSVMVQPNLFSSIVDGQEVGTAITDPVFGSFKFDFAGSTPSLEATERDVIKVEPTAENKLRLSFTNKGGQEYSLNIYTGDGAATDCITTSVDSFDLHMDGLEVQRNEYVVISSAGYSHILQLKRISSTDSAITVRDVANDGAQVDWSYSSGAGTMKYDGHDFPFVVGGTDHINVTSGATNAVTTKAGATITMNSTGACDLGNSTIPAMTITVTEETSYNDGSPDDYSVITLPVRYNYGVSNNDLYVETPTQGSVTGTAWSGFVQVKDSYDYEALTAYGTLVKYNNNNYRAELDYFGDETYYKVFVAPTDAVTTTVGGAGGSYLSAVEINPVGAAKLDTEVAGNELAQNLIVVGGPCINQAARVWMGADPANCAAGFKDGEAIIKLYEQGGKVALLVAGMTADDTRAAATAVAGGKLATVAKGVKEVRVGYVDKTKLETITLTTPTTTTTS